ncbi:hypothetical protein E2556_06790 [Staphylococcus croceilyticus]|uniref:Uncharacterized protein n=1 Tax=Staphylococcus croceilyticus TaxID=319942 RepID=A0ABY2KGP2_9STAP|nr:MULTISPECIES: hypothetical protein [Staphylococcus]MCI2773692.1 hypothetical protein [Staphylococcus petrasii]PNZ67010.1 hypothetical protein CD128_09080 [Staphylococcus croceilyticus]PNZ80538.1 hypothetical protein CD127_10060 [Staphylococcus petrasii]TGA79434.1 hypothetical protein E2556_06790 [Staphylococcus croceilyticus]TGA82133.1 hypothetical protein E2554_00880 [Staphylococcus petrasii]
MNNEDKRTKQIRFEFKWITIPYVIFAVIVLLLNIFYTNIKVTMALFGLFFAYNLGMLFIAFINKYKRTLILTLILTILSAATFFILLYVFGLNREIFG